MEIADEPPLPLAEGKLPDPVRNHYAAAVAEGQPSGRERALRVARMHGLERHPPKASAEELRLRSPRWAQRHIEARSLNAALAVP